MPRSGTSILGRVLDKHPRISTWVEPYYVWDHHFRAAKHDELAADDATEEIRSWIRKAFAKYRQKMKADIVVDKSPRTCLKIPFVREVFPEARFIFIFRDGRDTILSISRQWEKKREIFDGNNQGRQWRNRSYVFQRWLSRRPTWSIRLQSILFELGPPRNWIQRKFLNKIRWEGRFGWGPRFKGWQDIANRTTPLEFSAFQWVHCAQAIVENINLIPKERLYALKYEDFTKNPQTSIKNLLSFLDIEPLEDFLAQLPQIWSDNSNKWRQGFSIDELKMIGPIIGKTLIEFGYERDESWYQCLDP